MRISKNNAVIRDVSPFRFAPFHSQFPRCFPLFLCLASLALSLPPARSAHVRVGNGAHLRKKYYPAPLRGARCSRRFWSRSFAAIGLAIEEGEKDEERHVRDETYQHRHRLAASTVAPRESTSTGASQGPFRRTNLVLGVWALGLTNQRCR